MHKARSTFTVSDFVIDELNSAKKELKKLDSVAQKTIKEKLLLLVENPEILKLI